MSHISTTRRNFLAGLGASALGASAFTSTAARAQGLATESSGGPALASLWQGLELVDADDNNFSIKDATRPLTLVKLWANWCPVCINEIEQLDRVVSALGPQNLDVLLISHPDWWGEDQEAAKRRGFRFRLATPDSSNGRGRIQAALTTGNGLYAVPRSLVFRRAGEVVMAHQGAMNWTDDSVVAQLKGAVA
jgi:peroxiredoxin